VDWFSKVVSYRIATEIPSDKPDRKREARAGFICAQHDLPISRNPAQLQQSDFSGPRNRDKPNAPAGMSCPVLVTTSCRVAMASVFRGVSAFFSSFEKSQYAAMGDDMFIKNSSALLRARRHVTERSGSRFETFRW